MSLAFKPHTIAIYAITDTADSQSVAANPTDGAAATVLGQVTPLSVADAFDRYGVDSKAPFLVLTDANAATVKVGQKVVWLTRTYRVVKAAETYEGIGAADHSAFVMEYSEAENA